ncbi:MAG: multi-sensor signal transduction histidine kinase [Actinomycetia bacterium]|nr:multi-sensor signal transduction histidine kinase [Actinomycetes bacterium]
MAKGELASIKIRTELVPESTGKTGVHSLPFSKAVYAQIRPQPDLEDLPANPLSKSTQRVKIWVEDTGIGIPEQAHEKIFGIFERATSSDEFPGTGIGLAIVARAVERMDGRCGVESSPAGSKFWLELYPAEERR